MSLVEKVMHTSLRKAMIWRQLQGMPVAVNSLLNLAAYLVKMPESGVSLRIGWVGLQGCLELVASIFIFLPLDQLLGLFDQSHCLGAIAEG